MTIAEIRALLVEGGLTATEALHAIAASPEANTDYAEAVIAEIIGYPIEPPSMTTAESEAARLWEEGR
ncbi:hypothetical protein [Myxococcus phage Mx1]|nr:hypothetical protein [Myxococcus phage Mx1]